MAMLVKHPHRVHLAIIALVAVEAGVISFLWPDAWAEWSKDGNSSTRIDLLVGTLGAAAIVTGFSGVVSVFGLSADSDAFIKFRVRAGIALRENWAAVSQAGLLSMGFALAAAVCATFSAPVLAMYLFQLSILFLLENGVRSVWLLRQLVKVAHEDDKARYPDLT